MYNFRRNRYSLRLSGAFPRSSSAIHDNKMNQQSEQRKRVMSFPRVIVFPMYYSRRNCSTCGNEFINTFSTSQAFWLWKDHCLCTDCLYVQADYAAIEDDLDYCPHCDNYHWSTGDCYECNEEYD